MAKIFGGVLALAAGYLTLAACGLMTPQQATPAPPVNITNVTPPGDSSDTVLLTMVIGLLVCALTGGGVLLWKWGVAKQRLSFAEGALTELTGVPPHRLALMSVQQLRREQSATHMAYQAAPSSPVMRELR